MQHALSTALFLICAVIAVLSFIAAGFLAALYGDAAFIGAFGVSALFSIAAAIANLGRAL